MTQTPRTDTLVKELYEDAAKRKKAPVPVRDPFDRAIELCYDLERQLAERDRQLAEAQRDAGRLAVLWTLACKQLTINQALNILDTAIQEQKK